MKAPTISRRIWLVISTVMITGSFFAYYFFVYMKARQADLEARKFRALTQYAENITNGYFELTKKSLREYKTFDKIPQDKRDTARNKVIKPIIKQSDFTALLFDVDGEIVKQTFRNTIDKNIIQNVILKDKSILSRKLELQINNEDYYIFIHEFELAGDHWRIFGFCSSNRFQAQVREVDLIYVVVASLFVVLVLLVMPLLKLWIMNEQEKLKAANVWFAGYSIVAGSSFLLVMLMMGNDFFINYSTRSSDSLLKDREVRITALSDEVNKRFAKELHLVYDQIMQAKSKRYHDLVEDWSKGENALLGDVLSRNVSFNNFVYPYFNEILWVKEDGATDVVLATHHLDGNDTVNLSQRTYFSNALKNDTWQLPDDDSPEKRIALQSIHSYFSNHHEAGIGTILDAKAEKGKPAVLAIATKLNSVMDPLLPPGYQFAIVDKKGKVWFHSIIDKNLNENFFDEAGWNNQLTAAVNGRSTAFVHLKYDRASHLAYIRPVRNTELFLVVLHDDEYFHTPIVLTVGLAALLVFILFAAQGIHQLILMITTYRFSLLKIRRFFLAWLRPQKEKLTVYQNGVWVQVLLLIPAGFVVGFFHSVYLVIVFLTLPIFLLLYHYFSLAQTGQQRQILWTHPFLIPSILLILFINFSTYFYLESHYFALAVGIQSIIAFILLVAYGLKPFHIVRPYLGFSQKPLLIRSWIPGVIRDRIDRLDSCYYIFLLIWLFIVSIIPTFYFYKVSYYEESKVWTRYMLLTAAQQEDGREMQLKRDLTVFDLPHQEAMIEMGDYLRVTGEIASATEREGPVEDRTLPELMFKGLPALSGQAESSRAAIYPVAGDGRWAFSMNNFFTRMNYRTQKGNTEFYQSQLQPYQFFKGDYKIVLMVVIFLGVLVLYRTLRFCITHIFGLGLLSEEDYKVPVLYAQARYFVVGLPHSGKSKLVQRIREDYHVTETQMYLLDISKREQVDITKDHKLIVATNFHLDLTNHISNQQKLEKMEAFRAHPDIPVIIVSNLDPCAVLDFYDRLATHYRKKDGEAELDGNYSKCIQSYRKWKNMLSGYVVYFHALQVDHPFADAYIDYELNHGQYLPQLSKQVPPVISTRREREEMVLEVEVLSQLYYQAIWNCLSPGEKFLLHDLAKDRFVNMRNMKTIRTLRQKGLLVLRNSLNIMNKSFNNFVLSVVEEDEEVRMEEQMRKKGSWNTLHLILVIAIGSVVIFLGVAQQELFKTFEASLAAVVTLIPLLMRFGGLFSGDKAKE